MMVNRWSRAAAIVASSALVLSIPAGLPAYAGVSVETVSQPAAVSAPGAVQAAVPSAPRMVALWITGDRSLSATWRAPQNGKPIKGYRVGMSVIYPGSSSWSEWRSKAFAPSVRRVTMTVQTECLVVRVAVQARNASGWGPISEPVVKTMPCATASPEPEPTTPEPTPTPEPEPTTDPCAQYPVGSMDYILCNHKP
jgi:hypothetical protein